MSAGAAATARPRNAPQEEERPEPGQSPRRVAGAGEPRPQQRSPRPGGVRRRHGNQLPAQRVALQLRQAEDRQQHAGDVLAPGPRSAVHRPVRGRLQRYNNPDDDTRPTCCASGLARGSRGSWCSLLAGFSPACPGLPRVHLRYRYAFSVRT